MHRSPSGLALLVAASILSLAAPALAQERDAQGEQAMLDAINARRAAASLPLLSRDGQLDAAALLHSAEMADRNVLEHVSEQSGTPADRVHATGLAIDELAENVAMHHSVGDAQQSLEGSAPHLANMMNERFTHIGLAAVRDERGFYVTQVFGRIEPAGIAIGTAPQVEMIAPEAAAVPAIPPTVVAPEVPQAAPQVLEVAPPESAGIALQASPGYSASVAPGTRATVIVPGPQGGVSGYWICASSRWWYYPMPAGAQPGQHLSPDLSVTGAPPGYAVTGCVAGQMVQPLQPQVYSPPPPVYSPPPVAYAPPPPVYYPPPPPRVYYPPPPPRVYYPQPPPRRRVIVMPPPGTVIAPYAPVYRGGGVRIEVAPRRGVRVEGRWGGRRR